MTLDLRHEAVLVTDGKSGNIEDKTPEVINYRRAGDGKVEVTYRSRAKPYLYSADRVQILRSHGHRLIGSEEKVEVDGAIWERATGVSLFAGGDHEWVRIAYVKGHDEVHSRVRPAGSVRILLNATSSPPIGGGLNYLQAVASRLPADDTLRQVYESLNFVHPDSALARYLAGGDISGRQIDGSAIFPFRSNLSQRQAVDHALTHSFSVIEGPPGTGKTETILNIISNIIAVGSASVGVVSFSNTAVDNVREKLDHLGFGFVVARLGNRGRRRDFFVEGQPERNARVAAVVTTASPAPALETMSEIDSRLHQLQQAERKRALLQQEADAHALELSHFEIHVSADELPDLGRLPLLRRSPDRILDYLAETQLAQGRRPGLVGRIKQYFRYGSLRGLDPDDTGMVLRLQRAFYDQRIAEIAERLETIDRQLERGDFEGLAERHRVLSEQILQAGLAARYDKLSRTVYLPESYRRSDTFRTFATDYPVLLSTCHSLIGSLPPGHLLDYLIIDEASQVSLLAACAAMSCARNVVVVGDLKQLPHIAGEAAAGLVPPLPAFDYEQHSILSSLIERYPGALPRTLLVEHYRCDPAIIGFCNKAFYDEKLVPYSKSDGRGSAMVVWSTAEGNHMRQHRGGGRSNEREVDVIVREVIPQECKGVSRADIGIATPYRLQADKATAAFVEEIERIDADTVHKYQGRQKRVMIMTTVLDETWRGQTGLSFVDDPQMINVAVSRAVAKFVLVTNHDLLSKSRYVRDLIDYINYQASDAGLFRSDVVSVFDLLYREYAKRLEPLAARLRHEIRFPSEDIVWTVLNELLEDKYGHLRAVSQVYLRNLFPDTTRLTPPQARYLGNRASVDFVVYNRVSNRPVLAIEVDGFKYHENDPRQLERDALKNEIFRSHGMPLLRLPTTGSEEIPKIRAELDHADSL